MGLFPLTEPARWRQSGICCRWVKRWALIAVPLRFFNVYGPGQTYTPYVGVITIFATKLLAGEVPTIFGDGEQVRDFVHVNDIVQGLVRAMRQGRAGQTYNIGSSVGRSVNEVARVVCDTLAPDIRPVYTELHRGRDAQFRGGYQPREGRAWVRTAGGFRAGHCAGAGYDPKSPARNRLTLSAQPSRQGLFVDTFRFVYKVLSRMRGVNMCVTRPGICWQPYRCGEGVANGMNKRSRIGTRGDPSCAAITHDFGMCADVCRENRQAPGHGFEHADRKAFPDRGQNEDICLSKKRAGILDKSVAGHVVQRVRQAFDLIL